MITNDDGAKLAAETYASNRLTQFPQDGPEFSLLLQTAFLEGAYWQNQQAVAEIESRINNLYKTLYE